MVGWRAMATLRHNIGFTLGATAARVLPKRLHRRIFRRVMDRPAVLHEFWRQNAPPGNVPADYVRAVGRSKALLELLADLPTGARVLEVGCNVGRNLAHLHQAGYVVEGIEINSSAVALLRHTYPQLADVTVHVGPAEDLLQQVPDNSFDLVFTMAVIEHIHPDSSVVFDRMAGIAPQVLAIEPPGSVTHRQYPHHIPTIFGERGMRLMSQTPMSQLGDTTQDRGINWYDAYRFVR